MSRLERYILYPVLVLLSWAVFARDWPSGVETASAEPNPKRAVVEAQEFRLID